ncbi:allantoate amidohydrolase [Kocuria sp. JC486]|uniref:allantoate amidohydrolase n=1 Tax=Kocuria sp. JC486 TaxID=1970736 RepID=UPI0014237BA3|nr:allantoate amidohydrolase [Kocuria sp. JC486]
MNSCDQAQAHQVMDRCAELATISVLSDGIERTYLTPEHAKHNALAAEWMQAAGLTVRVDPAGTLIGRLEGARPGLPALVVASHLDTVPDAGRYDGILGVVSGIAVAQRLRSRAGELPFALEVCAYGDEEGVRFGATLLGSRAMAGTWDPEWLQLEDRHGIRLEQAFRDFGLDPTEVPTAAKPAQDLVGYLELHIEQGPLLEAADRRLGVVTAIAGARRFAMQIHGDARHAGGTPYDRRRDALVGAAMAVQTVERIGRESGVIATVGRLQAHPGAVNVVPGLVDFSLDLRAADDLARDRAWGEILAEIETTCGRRGLELTVEEIHSAPTVTCAPWLMDAVTEGIRSTGDQSPMEIWSRAGHDAMAMAAVTDVGMIFVRCEDGISHHPGEAVLQDDVAAGLDALEAAVWAVARRVEIAAGDHASTPEDHEEGLR